MPSFVWIQEVIFPILGMGMVTFFGWQILRMINGHLERKSLRRGGVEVEGLREEMERLRAVVESSEDLRPQVADLEERVEFAERMLARRQPGELQGRHE